MLNGYAKIVNEAIVIEGRVTSLITPYSYTRLNRDDAPKMAEITALISANPKCNEVQIINFEFLDTALYDFVQNLKNIQKVKLGVRDIEDCRKFEWRKVKKDPFVELVTDNNVLEELDLSNQALGDETVLGIVNAIKKNPNSKLKILKLNGVSLGESATYALAELLESNKTLEALNISSNQNIGAIAAIKIAQALEKNATLKELHIAGCGIEIFKTAKPRTFTQIKNESETERDAAGKAFAAMLCKNETLQVLDLGGNWIKKNASIEIARALRVNNTLHTIYMHSNYMPDVAAKEWATTIKENDSLLGVDIHGMNHITLDGATLLATAFNKNKTLQEIKFWYGGFNAKEFAERNKKLKPTIAANRKAKQHKQVVEDSEPNIASFLNDYLQSNEQTDNVAEKKRLADEQAARELAAKAEAEAASTNRRNAMLAIVGIALVVGAIYSYRKTNLVCKVLPKVLSDMLSKSCELSR